MGLGGLVQVQQVLLECSWVFSAGGVNVSCCGAEAVAGTLEGSVAPWLWNTRTPTGTVRPGAGE